MEPTGFADRLDEVYERGIRVTVGEGAGFRSIRAENDRDIYLVFESMGE